MNTNRDFDRIASGWLAEGPTELNDRVLDAALDEVHLTHQRRRPAVPWRTPYMSTPMRLAAAIAIVAIVGFAGLTLLGGGSNIGGPAATPTCTSAPAPSVVPPPGSTPFDRATWTTYVSRQFGFSICYPADWSLLKEGAPSDPRFPGLDPGEANFIAPDTSIYLTARSVAVAPGMTLDAYIRATCVQDGTTCDGWQAQSTAVTVDGHPGVVALFGTSEKFVEAFLLVDNRIYYIWSGRAPGDNDSDRLVRTFFSTMHLLPGGPVPVGTAGPS